MKANQPRGAVVLTLAAAASASVAFALLGAAPLGGRAPAFGDNVSFWAPSTAYLKMRAADGEVPLWNPHVLGGIPFAADINHGIFYPPNWLSLVLPAADALVVLLMLHLALGAFGMYLFLARMGVPAPAALWGGVAFALSVSYVSLVNHLVMLESMACLPLVLWAARRLAEKPTAASSLVCALFLALSALAGDVHATYMAALAGGALVAVECARRLFAGETRTAAAVAGSYALSGAAALALAAVAVFPAVELARLTARNSGALSYAAHNGLDAPGAVGILAPLPWGSVREGTAWNFRWSDAVYVGGPLVLLAGWGGRRLAERFSGVLLVMLGGALSFGALSPVWRLAYHFLPGFRNFRQPREYFIIAVAGFILLGAWGLWDLAAASQGTGAKPKKRRKRDRRVRLSLMIPSALIAACAVFFVFFGARHAPALAEALHMATPGATAARCLARAGGVALVALGLSGVALSVRGVRLHASVGVVLLACIIWGDLAFASVGHLVFGPRELYCGAPAAVAALRERLLESASPRFAPVGPGWGAFFERFAARAVEGAPAVSMEDALRVKECLVDNEPVYAGLASALGYSTFLPTRYALLYSLASGQGVASPVRLPGRAGCRWALLGVGAVLNFDPTWKEREVRALAAPPGVFMAYDWRAVDSVRAAAALLKRDRASAFSSPVVEGGPPARPAPSPGPTLHSIEDVSRSAESLSMLVHTDRPGLLVVLENNYPGWRAWDNGLETDIYTANLTFRAVYLSAGRHRVEFKFVPLSLYIGAAVSLASFALLLAAAAAAGVRAWRK